MADPAVTAATLVPCPRRPQAIPVARAGLEVSCGDSEVAQERRGRGRGVAVSDGGADLPDRCVVPVQGLQDDVGPGGARTRLRAAIGDNAESLVYLYNAWGPEHHPLPPRRDAVSPPSTSQAHRDIQALIAAMAAYTPHRPSPSPTRPSLRCTACYEERRRAQ